MATAAEVRTALDAAISTLRDARDAADMAYVNASVGTPEGQAALTVLASTNQALALLAEARNAASTR